MNPRPPEPQSGALTPELYPPFRESELWLIPTRKSQTQPGTAFRGSNVTSEKAFEGIYTHFISLERLSASTL